ncbi:BolA protein [Nicoletella semolina]|uniref:DNA-binding transcriptional regulator BolA n=1 Tax=Nicoletella semolina TaxID=271160 RepID=A0A4R2NCL5_9PAST|nr:BolA/IbaG family iron-sulfur metabolism protein [Nicoletella semolina]MDH2924210.1 transcriptional regulator [Nicoletella semolina]TCP18893.1 BolA protein [Nicoletella semolina]
MSIEQTITDKLTQQFTPEWLEIENESHKHSSGRGSESHFKVTLVSAFFEESRLVARHRAIYQCLADELANGVHALALHIYTPAEWQECNETVPPSPNCLGHGK